MAPPRVLGTRSHSFPSFYACYLLRSVQTPQSTAVYIGSTPSPPRRIRQHNGEIVQGARKTQSKRPWVMQMIVHGFPSRLAALQFEWAWQHPHRSRHFCDENGRIFGTRAAKNLSKNIAIVRTMISIHPFNTWPLHVKLFTEEAVRLWKVSGSNGIPLLPPGFTCSIELEGVDGKSGHPGSGRQGPIAVDDANFTSAYLAKNTALIASGRRLDCSICHQPLHSYPNDPLTTALCPSPACIAVSHITCLSSYFLNVRSDEAESNLIPRGGHCTSCGNYTLWGDVIRGCYRRLTPAEGETIIETIQDDMFVSDEENEDALGTPKWKNSTEKRSSSRSSTARRSSKANNSKKAIKTSSSSSGEGEPEGIVKRKRGRPRKSIGSEDEQIELTKIVSSSEAEDVELAKRGRGRPRKHMEPTPPAPSPITSPALRKIVVPRKLVERTRGLPRKSSSTEDEVFDFTNIASSSDSEGVKLVKLRRGRPRKEAESLPDPEPLFPIKSPKLWKNSKGEGILKPTKATWGRPRKVVELSPLVTSPKSQRIAPIMSPSKKKIHTQAADTAAIRYQAESSSGESFNFDGLSGDEASDEDFIDFLARRTPRSVFGHKSLGAPKSLAKASTKPSHIMDVDMSRPPDIWMDDDPELDQVMSVLSVSSPGLNKNLEIIELSD